MLQARREELTHAQHGLDRLQRIRETLTQTPDTTRAYRQAIAHARARIDDLDLPGKQHLLDLLSVQAQAASVHRGVGLMVFRLSPAQLASCMAPWKRVMSPISARKRGCPRARRF
jgi:hypothetical protein